MPIKTGVPGRITPKGPILIYTTVALGAIADDVWIELWENDKEMYSEGHLRSDKSYVIITGNLSYNNSYENSSFAVRLRIRDCLDHGVLQACKQ